MEVLSKPEATTSKSGKVLRDYQLEAVSRIASTGRFLLADEMGLGKTATAICALKEIGVKRVAIVCPATIKSVWSKEIADWWGEHINTEELSGTKPKPISIEEGAVYMSYTVSKNWTDEVIGWGAEALVIDESHRIANYKTKQTKAVLLIAKNIVARLGTVIAITGTPIVNRAFDLAPQLEAIGHFEIVAPSREAFLKEHCHLIKQHIGKGQTRLVYKGIKNPDSLHEKISPISLARKKQDVLSELPEKTYVDIPVPKTSLKGYREYKDISKQLTAWVQGKIEREDFTHRLENDNGEDPVGSMMIMLRVKAEEMKIEACFELIDDVISSGEKVVVFCNYKKSVASIVDKYKGAAIGFTGDTKEKERGALIEDFQNNENTKVFACTIGAGGEGITLTAASYLIFLGIAWSPAKEAQASDRIHRLGQSKPATIYRLIAEETIDEVLVEIISKKEDGLSEALTGEEDSTTKKLLDFFREIPK